MRTLKNNYSTIVLLDRDVITLKLMEIFLRSEGYDGFIVKTSDVAETRKVLAEAEAPVLLITDYFTNYLDNFHFFEECRHLAAKVIVVGEFEEELKRFKNTYTDISFYRKPHSVNQVKEWFEV